MDPMTIGAALVAVVGVGFALLHKPAAQDVQASAQASVQTGRARNPGRQLIDHCDEMGRDGAGILIGKALAQVEAEEIAAKFGRAFGKITPVQAASTPPPGAPAPNV